MADSKSLLMRLIDLVGTGQELKIRPCQSGSIPVWEVMISNRIIITCDGQFLEQILLSRSEK